VLQACEEFKSITRKLLDKPNTIEELSDLREWSKNIPERVAQHQVRLHTGVLPQRNIR